MELGQVDDVDPLVLEGGDKRRLPQRGWDLAVAGRSLQAEIFQGVFDVVVAGEGAIRACQLAALRTS